MSTQPRIDSAIPGEVANFGTVTAHSPEVIARFFDLYAEFWQDGEVSAELKELTRIRNARVTDCGY
ncbi:MAG: hypothetical protein GKR90_08550 [Pseudomonadales bacterium]|nr:hypothetical protein [Pseudomonadales bacterium]